MLKGRKLKIAFAVNKEDFDNASSMKVSKVVYWKQVRCSGGSGAVKSTSNYMLSQMFE